MPEARGTSSSRKLTPLDPVLTSQQGRYLLRSPLDIGEVGVVFHAEALHRAGEQVAIHMPFAPFQQEVSFHRRYHDCASQLAGVAHPGLVAVREVVQGPLCWRVMELVEGWRLDELVERTGTPPAPLVARWVADIGEALLALHAAQDCHGRLCARRVLITADGTARLCGWMSSAAGEAEDVERAGATSLAPEQLRLRGKHARTDVYQLALLAVTLLTGDDPFAIPFGLEDPPDLAAMILSGVRLETLPGVAAIPAAWRPLLQRALAADLRERPPLDELLAAWEAVARPPALEEALPIPVAAALSEDPPSRSMDGQVMLQASLLIAMIRAQLAPPAEPAPREPSRQLPLLQPAPRPPSATLPARPNLPAPAPISSQTLPLFHGRVPTLTQEALPAPATPPSSRAVWVALAFLIAGVLLLGWGLSRTFYEAERHHASTPMK